ncbi:bacteriohopanetetrol glucosamine biosynthesis glycosyltransferase HpnI [Sphingomonas sp. MMS24-J13]|uniref:bacteriohopanetetrol glucosamine biosynthesis glycosyltransferase HpnI n=1 Tax=Sphingomonas sp. MMS24-J13 TaxID=3238686 RepID=UPI00384DCFB2
MTTVAILLLLLAWAGIGYTVFAALIVGRFDAAPQPPAVAAEPVTLLKPLYGAEPKLTENLASFLDQEWDAPIEMVAGVQRADDPAIAVARSLGPAVRPVVDPTPHGANAKVGNLINMMAAARHDLIVLSDSDMAAPRDYLARVAAALAQPGVGAVSLLYRGRGDAGFWSDLAGMAISYHFLPSVLVARLGGKHEPCMGSTIALRRDTLDRIGGFARFADTLADDAAIGAAVNAIGLHVACPRLVVTHGCVEASLRDLMRHELRWAATVKGVDPRGYIGLGVTYPVAWAMLALPFAPVQALVTLTAAIAARLFLMARVDRLAGSRSGQKRWLVLRDCLSFAVFILSFSVRSVDWRGVRLNMDRDGRTIRTQGVENL